MSKSDLVPSGLNAIRYGELYTIYNVSIRSVRSFIDASHASSCYPIKRGDILFPCSGETAEDIGRPAVYLLDEECYAGGDIITFRPIRGEALFIVYALNSFDAIRFRARRAKGHTVVHIYADDLGEYRLPFPPLGEQQRIAAILSTWDRAIELTEKLIAAKQKRKTALMQTLLTGKVRLPKSATGHWRACQLGDVASNSSRRNGTPTTTPQVYSVTNSVGMVPMSEDVIGESIDRYKTVGKHDFAYNPMRINVGSIAMWEGDEDVLVSPDYVVFQCGDELDAEFLNHFRKTHFWHQFVNRSGGGSVRVRIYFSDLAEMPLKLPPLTEQQAIAAVLNNADSELALHRRKLDALRRQKKGLMQQLLTGKVRVQTVSEPGTTVPG